MSFLFFFFNDTATTEIYTLSLHDALPIRPRTPAWPTIDARLESVGSKRAMASDGRSEEHTSELQSPDHLVCRLLLEKNHFYKRTARLACACAPNNFPSPPTYCALSCRRRT